MQWSYSRRNLLGRCPRAYYYQYYGANKRMAKAEPLKEHLYFLKTLKNRYLRTGQITHLVIQTYLNKFQKEEAWSVERLLNWARQIFQKDYAYSRKYRPGDTLPTGRYPPVLLLEFYRRLENADRLFLESESRMLEALRNFAVNPEFSDFRRGACYSNALIEKSISIKNSHFSMRGQIDLAYPHGDRIVVVDWKIGKTGGNDDSLQLLSYALGAIKEFNCQPDCIDLYRIHLSDSSIEASNVSEMEVSRAKGRIIQDLERMEMMDEYGKQAVVEAFTPCAQPLVCAQCVFESICPKE